MPVNRRRVEIAVLENRQHVMGQLVDHLQRIAAA